MKALYDEFFQADREECAAISRRFLPFLREQGPERTFLLRKLEKEPALLLEFDFTSEEFELLELEKYEEILPYTFAERRFELAYAICKAIGKYGTCCHFPDDTLPREILEELNSHLGENDIATCFIERADVKEMLRYGLAPCPYVSEFSTISGGNVYLNGFEYYEQGMTEEEMKYWLDMADPYEHLCKVGFWSLITKGYCEEVAKVGNSFPMLFHFPELLYRSDSVVERVGEDGAVRLRTIPGSKRPKTDMSLFQTPVSHKYSSLEDLEFVLQSKKIAVTRYASGMSKGLFYGERPADICGYFYYAEPQSSTFLSYETSLTAFNKTDAAEKLIALGAGKELEAVFGQFSNTKGMVAKDLRGKYAIRKHINGTYTEDLRFTAKTAQKKGIYSSTQELPTSTRKVYLANILGLYAYEDKLDQPLCRAAAKLGYDLVILTHMVGSHQVVTEVLDTRENSIKHLWFLR